MRPPATGASPQIALNTVDLPDPELADDPEQLAFEHREADTADGFDALRSAAEDDLQLLGLELDRRNRRRLSVHQALHAASRSSTGSGAFPPPILGRQFSRPRV